MSGNTLWNASMYFSPTPSSGVQPHQVIAPDVAESSAAGAEDPPPQALVMASAPTRAATATARPMPLRPPNLIVLLLWDRREHECPAGGWHVHVPSVNVSVGIVHVNIARSHWKVFAPDDRPVFFEAPGMWLHSRHVASLIEPRRRGRGRRRRRRRRGPSHSRRHR